MNIKNLVFIIASFAAISVGRADTLGLKDGELIRALNQQLTEVLVTDGFSPPAASRIYCYANIAAYECLVPYNPQYLSMKGQLTDFNGFDHVPRADVDRDLLLVFLFVNVSKELVYRTHILDHFRQAYVKSRNDLQSEEMISTQSEANRLTALYLAWLSKDNYKMLKEAERYVPFSGPQFWEPTPPAYMDALEPNWRRLRPMVLKSLTEVEIATPTPFDTTRTSQFYKEAMDVYRSVNSIDDERLHIAKFWDCNPLQTQTMGHFNFVSRQLTPGGHWLGIVGICTRKEKFDLMKTTESYLLVCLGLHDSFLVAWAEKFKSCLIRPETYINRYIDPNWRPLLETPPFPEHPSAHSVISASSSRILTKIFGDNFYFEDDTEVGFGLGTRKFSSFEHAANEAAISRLYGGIHYLPAIEHGKTVGRIMGGLILNRIRTTP